jgi:hypothetical protein
MSHGGGRGGYVGHSKKVRKLFSPEEDALLCHIMFEQQFTTWIAVAAQMPGRTARQCRDRWANYLSPDNKNGPWTVEEDRRLAEKFLECGPQWTTISRFFDGRSENNVKNRWYTHLRGRHGPDWRTEGNGDGNKAPEAVISGSCFRPENLVKKTTVTDLGHKRRALLPPISELEDPSIPLPDVITARRPSLERQFGHLTSRT